MAFFRRRAPRARRAVLLLLLLDVACSSSTEPSFPSNAVAFAPPPVYRLWWSIVESCSGMSGDLAAVHFYEEPDQVEATAGSESANAYWFASGDRIVVGGMNEYDGPVIRHEMLHALLGSKAGGNGHPHAYFVQRCGGIVHCIASCLTDDGPLSLPDASAPVVSPATLDVGVSVEPAPFDPARYDGWMAVLVTARNPLPHAIWVQLPSGPGSSTTFGYAIANSPVDAAASTDSGSVPFAAGETHRQLFDVHVTAGKVTLVPGSYDVRGFFAGDSSVAQPLLVLGGN